ncbi:CPBP family glutamic-type intramembrane protease [Pseudoxanthomonas beigongshangi]|uniref:CPBP family glutamic-type intramembrane protease n=1 Tax=Pseudoxanthomonas beigongshangi TaxID=2782537 RepID=UPI00193BC91B|nr:CPBP family glutamic-type intramembrane protease [Pseudoxanthomonas beigongshangi]
MKFLLFGSLASFLSAAMVAYLLFRYFGLSASMDAVPKTHGDVALFILTSVIAAPALETMLLAWLFSALVKARFGAMSAAVICVIAFAAAHAMREPYQMLVVLIPGAVFMLPFTRVGERGIKRCVLLSMGVHALHNAYAVVAFLVN